MIPHCKYCQSENVYFSKKRNIFVCEDCGKSFLIEKKVIPQKVFLSYGHDHNAEIVDLIYNSLLDRGHIPWIDKAEIKAGHDWRKKISKGIMESNNFLAFISDYSVRVPGVCLDEIAIGVGNWNCRIQSIILEKNVKVPNSISNIQWLDLSDWREIKYSASKTVDWNAWIKERITKIFDIVEDEHSAALAGNISFLEEKLEPITSTLKLRSILRNEIIGREWLISIVSDLFIKTSNSILIIYGTPGTGKSVFAAYLCNFSPDCIASFFCEWNNSITQSVRKMICSIIFQLACGAEDYQEIIVERLSGVDIDIISDDELFFRYLLEPLNQLIDGGRQHKLIIIDAIDETASEQQEFLRIIKRMVDQFPHWIKIIVTSRPEEKIMLSFQGYSSVFIDDYFEEIKNDISEFVYMRIQNEFDAKKIINKSNGSFVYARELMNLYQDSNGSIDYHLLPPGLGGLYYTNFERLFAKKDSYENQYRRFFELLFAAREQISIGEIQKILSIPISTVHSRLRKIRSYILELKQGDILYLQVFHKSFLEWLTTEGAGKYCIDPKRGDKMFEQSLIDIITNNKEISEYMMKHAWDHIDPIAWEELDPKLQKQILSRLFDASALYGNLEKEYFYLHLLEIHFGNNNLEYYLHAIEYYKKTSGEKLLEIAEKALQFKESIYQEKDEFNLVCQIAFAYFYAGYAQKSYDLITMERANHPDDFWNDEINEANYWHVVAVSAHDLDNNIDVIKAAEIDVIAYRNQKKFYDQYISMVNLFDGYMAVGKLEMAEKVAERLFKAIESRYYIHVEDILHICYANLLLTGGRVMEALTYYESGLLLAADIQKWDYLYGSIWRELAIAEFGDKSCFKSLVKYKKMAQDAGYNYLVSLANCFFIISDHIFQESSNDNTLLQYYNEILSIGMPGHILQASICCMIKGLIPFEISTISKMIHLCEGVKGVPELIEEFAFHFKDNISNEYKEELDTWCKLYIKPISAYKKNYWEKCTEKLDALPLLGKYDCHNCQAKCCYDGVYLSAEEEKKITEFVSKYADYFTWLERPYIVNGNWPGMTNLRKTATKPYPKYGSDFPSHFSKTRCVFSFESGECSLQRLSTDQQMHPWKIKPRACWSFPIPGIYNGEILSPPASREQDPDYIDENYPGYISYLPCATPQNSGMPWFEKCKNEVEYYTYLIREGKLKSE